MILFLKFLDYNAEDKEDDLKKSIELGTRFLFTILAYAKEKGSLRDYVDKLKSMYSEHIPVSLIFF